MKGFGKSVEQTHRRVSGVKKSSSWGRVWGYRGGFYLGLLILSLLEHVQICKWYLPAKMWTIVHPLISQCSKSFSMSRGRLVGMGSTLVGSQVLLLPPKTIPIVYIPLKDYEVVALQQLSS